MTSYYVLKRIAFKKIENLLSLGVPKKKIYYVIMSEYGLGKRTIDQMIETIEGMVDYALKKQKVNGNEHKR